MLAASSEASTKKQKCDFWVKQKWKMQSERKKTLHTFRTHIYKTYWSTLLVSNKPDKSAVPSHFSIFSKIPSSFWDAAQGIFFLIIFSPPWIWKSKGTYFTRLQSPPKTYTIQYMTSSLSFYSKDKTLLDLRTTFTRERTQARYVGATAGVCVLPLLEQGHRLKFRLDSRKLKQISHRYVATATFTPLPMATASRSSLEFIYFFIVVFTSINLFHILTFTWGWAWVSHSLSALQYPGGSTRDCHLLYPHMIFPSRLQKVTSQIKSKIFALAIFNIDYENAKAFVFNGSSQQLKINSHIFFPFFVFSLPTAAVHYRFVSLCFEKKHKQGIHGKSTARSILS